MRYSTPRESFCRLLAAAGLCAFSAVANAQWTVTRLSPENGYAAALGIRGSQQVGSINGRAVVWNGWPDSMIDLQPPEASYSRASATNGTQQVGEVDGRAALWSGTAESLINLQSPWAWSSAANAIDGTHQSGFVTFPESNGYRWAALWNGTAASWTSLHPVAPPLAEWFFNGQAPDAYEGSVVTAAAGGRQGGYALISHYPNELYVAGLWSGTAESWTPLDNPGSQVLGMSEENQVGFYQRAGTFACMWRGTPNSRIILHPPESLVPFETVWSTYSSWALATNGQYQVGRVDGNIDTEFGLRSSTRAALWAGTSESYVDLHAFLPAGFDSSVATGVFTVDGTVFVTGYAENRTTSQQVALLWSGPCFPPTISAQPQPVSTCRTAVELSVTASAATPLSYRWQWRTPVAPGSSGNGPWIDVGGEPENSAFPIFAELFATGRTNLSTLVIRPLHRPTSPTEFRCIVLNACGQPVISAPVTVTFDDDTDSACAQPLTIDGVRDAMYGSPLHVQTTQTHFGDNTLTNGVAADGSELNSLSARIVDDVLYLHFAGNLESNTNSLEIFFDTAPGGQNTLRNDGAEPGLVRMGSDGTLPGLTFDADFSPDHYISITSFSSAMTVSFAELPAAGGGFGWFAGVASSGGQGQLVSAQLPSNIRVAYNNSNTAGVSAGTGPADTAAAAAVATGIELAVPLSALHLNTVPDTIKITAFVNGQQHDFVSNQVIGSVPPGTANPGEPRMVNFASIAGDQFVTIRPSTRRHAGWTAMTLGQNTGGAGLGSHSAFGGQMLVNRNFNFGQTIEPVIYENGWPTVSLLPTGAVAAWGYATDNSQQVGVVLTRLPNNQDRRTAALWRGSMASYINLNPASATGSYALGALANQQVGLAQFEDGLARAGFWRGDASTWTELHPPSAERSFAYATNGSQQGGLIQLFDPKFGWESRASLWNGSAASRIDLQPPGVPRPANSWVFAMSGQHQVGTVGFPGTGLIVASLWSGTPESWVNLNPASSSESFAWAASGVYQAGEVRLGSSARAALWAGSADSWVDLHQFLPSEYLWSGANGLWTDDQNAVVVGIAFNRNTGRQEGVQWIGPLPSVALCGESTARTTILSSPTSRTLNLRSSASLDVVASGTAPLSYLWQWRPEGPGTQWIMIDNGVNSGGGKSMVAAGATTASMSMSGFVLPPAPGSGTLSESWPFRCIVTGPCGSALSQTAELHLVPTGCNPADIADTDGNTLLSGSAPDLVIDNGDFTAFFNAFFADPTFPPTPSAADIANTDGDTYFSGAGPDGSVDNGDFTAFFNFFFSGCP